jgi:hypothetical protein
MDHYEVLLSIYAVSIFPDVDATETYKKQEKG